MKKNILALLSACALLVGCQDETAQQNSASAASAPTQISCSPSDLNAQLDQVLQQQINQTIQQYPHQWLDANKLAALVSQFHINTSNVNSSDNNSCVAQLNIGVGNEVLTVARTQAPLLKTPNPFDLITQELNGSNIRFDGQNFALPITYSVSPANNAVSIQNNNFNQVSNLIARAILPAGIKDLITVNGREISKEAYLNQMLQPEQIPQIEEPVQETETVHAIETEESESFQQAQTNDAGVELKPINSPEIIKPEPISSKISNTELDSARQANQLAGKSIKSAWQKIPADIQQNLVDEQKSWESKKRQSCRAAANKGKDGNERQYLQMQCDTRLTKERVQYLNGYSVE